MLVHPSLTEAAKKVDSLMWRALENLLWYQIREKNEGLGWDFKIDVPVDFLKEKYLLDASLSNLVD